MRSYLNPANAARVRRPSKHILFQIFEQSTKDTVIHRGIGQLASFVFSQDAFSRTIELKNRVTVLADAAKAR